MCHVTVEEREAGHELRERWGSLGSLGSSSFPSLQGMCSPGPPRAWSWALCSSAAGQLARGRCRCLWLEPALGFPLGLSSSSPGLSRWRHICLQIYEAASGLWGMEAAWFAENTAGESTLDVNSEKWALVSVALPTHLQTQPPHSATHSLTPPSIQHVSVHSAPVTVHPASSCLLWHQVLRSLGEICGLGKLMIRSTLRAGDL